MNGRPKLALRSYFYRLVFFGLLATLVACAGPQLRLDADRPEPSYAMAPATAGTLAEMAGRIEASYSPQHSGFSLLDGSHDALQWRLALIDSAVSSLDIMTYLWYPDVSGKLILERAVLAARRGVHVRLVVDDLLTIGQEQAHANLQREPNIEVRFFNPWGKRGVTARAGQMIAQMERLNTRMHDKLLIADGRAAILGGRNIGDHYFGLGHDFNFHDLDVLAIGHMAEQSNSMFDHFWNSELVASAENLTTEPDQEEADAGWQRMLEGSRSAPELESFSREFRDWSSELKQLETQLHPGTGYLIYDEVSAAGVDHSMLEDMYSVFDLAQHELLLANAYIIPTERGIEYLQGLNARGVDVQILTNSLASHDLPAVNGHYSPWRKPIIETGANLYEFRPDAAVKSLVDVPPVAGQFVGLHTKASVSDGRHVFIGSMNLDPRSAAINTEMGAVIDSEGLGEDLRTLLLRNMNGDNAWHVTVTNEGRLQWQNDDETVYKQPSRGFMQNVMNSIFKMFPSEQF